MLDESKPIAERSSFKTAEPAHPSSARLGRQSTRDAIRELIAWCQRPCAQSRLVEAIAARSLPARLRHSEPQHERSKQADQSQCRKRELCPVLVGDPAA